jgi:hypothetical protein
MLFFSVFAFVYNLSSFVHIQEWEERRWFLLFCSFGTVVIKHRQCLAFWNQRITFCCTRTYVLNYAQWKLTGNWLYLLSFLVLWVPWHIGIFQSITHTHTHTHTLWGTLPAWKSKSDMPLCKNIKAVGQIGNKTLWNVLHTGSNNLISVITRWETNYASFIRKCEYGKE